MTQRTAQACFLCQSRSYKELLRIEQPDRFEKHAGVSPQGYQRIWEECTGCGLAYDRHPAEALEKMSSLITQYYEADLSGVPLRTRYDKIMTLSPEKSDNVQRVQRIITFLKGESYRSSPVSESTRRILDIGTGTGVFLARFLKEVKANWEGTAVEPDPDAATHLRSLGLFKVVEGLFKGQSELGKFELCTFNKVLEHVQDPLSLLKKTKKVLQRSDGILYVEVPDKSTCYLRPRTDNILGSIHHHLYDVQSLSRLLQVAGFDVLSISKCFEPSGKITVFAFATLPEASRHFARQ